MSPERIKRIRDKLAAARAKGAIGTTTVDVMVLTLDELSELIDLADRDQLHHIAAISKGENDE